MSSFKSKEQEQDDFTLLFQCSLRDSRHRTSLLGPACRQFLGPTVLQWCMNSYIHKINHWAFASKSTEDNRQSIRNKQINRTSGIMKFIFILPLTLLSASICSADSDVETNIPTLTHSTRQLTTTQCLEVSLHWLSTPDVCRWQEFPSHDICAPCYIRSSRIINKYQTRKFPESLVHLCKKKSMVLSVFSAARGGETALRYN